ncbi:putative WRKY transcription factor 19 [Morella rubra]|uniref:Putative WRKY transcription factor 19 n=1 Tax=Morella rubra TaxID=262757 RepID=A0A6A1UJM1_9ROSI|nr:putative WRKY transcription factor 19 [Morella rubra]
MKKLRLFISHGARFRGKPLKYLPNELRVLVWDNYPSQVLPPKFVRNQLRVFRMHNSLIKELGGGEFKKLTRMELTGCNELREISDLSSSSNLKELDILDCPKLVKVHKSVGSLGNLVSLIVGRCCELRSFPKSLKLRSLKQLFISNCKRLKDFPEIECEMENVTTLSLHSTDLFSILFDCSDHGLKKLYLRGMNIDMLPSDMARFVRLTRLDLDDCKNLREIPELPQNIKEISARGCRSLERFSQLPKILWQFNESGLQDLKEVDVTGCHNLVCDVPKTSMFQGYPADLRVIEYCGFYPVYMNDEEEAAKDKSKMLYEGVDSNLESHWERKRKYSSTFGTQISSLEDGNDDAREEFDSKV